MKTPTPKRKFISEKVTTDYCFDFDGDNVADVIERLQKVVAENPQYDRLTFSSEAIPYCDGVHTIIRGSRYETDEEFEKRLAAEQVAKDKAEKLRYKEFLKLSKEFGKITK